MLIDFQMSGAKPRTQENYLSEVENLGENRGHHTNEMCTNKYGFSGFYWQQTVRPAGLFLTCETLPLGL